MSTHAQLVFAVGLALMMAVCACIFCAWLLWSIGWDLFDHFLQLRTRKRMSRFRARSSRDCFRDFKGLSK